jgi:hypothetical protein
MGTHFRGTPAGRAAPVTDPRAADQVILGNLLRLTDCVAGNSAEWKTEVSDYVPFSFWSSEISGQNGFVFLRDRSHHTFIEIWINTISGHLTHVVMIGRPTAVEAITDIELSRLTKKRGVPVFGEHGFDPEEIRPQVDHDIPLCARVTKDGFLACWSSNKPDARIDCDRSFFLFSGKLLIGLGVEKLTQPEMENIRYLLEG